MATIKLVVISLQTVLNLNKWELVRLCTNAHVDRVANQKRFMRPVEVFGLIL
jgi:hypothetical protein